MMDQGENHWAKAWGADKAKTVTPNRITEKVKAKKKKRCG